MSDLVSNQLPKSIGICKIRNQQFLTRRAEFRWDLFAAREARHDDIETE